MSPITQVQGVTPSELSQQITELLKLQIRELFDEAIARQSSDEDYLTSKDVQNLLNISHTTLYRKEKKGLIPFKRIGAKKLYKRGEITDLLQ